MNIFETCAENYVAIGSSAVLCSPFPVGSSTLTAGPTHYTSLLTITQIGCQILIFLYIIIFLSFPKKDVEEYKAMTGRCGDQSKRLVMSFQFILYTAACCLLPAAISSRPTSSFIAGPCQPPQQRYHLTTFKSVTFYQTLNLRQCSGLPVI